MATRIFLVEDSADLREAYEVLIGTLPGFQLCGSVASAEEAMEAIEAAKPDLTLVDISLPGLDGISFTQWMRDRIPHATVVILSGHERAVYEEPALKAGAKRFVMKHEGPIVLLDSIREVANARSSGEFSAEGT